MATTTPKLGLYKPELTDPSGTTMGTHLPANFDVIDDLAARANSYTSGVAGFTPNSIKAALDALAGVRIVEKGSNANGEYVRWENGLQVCWKQGFSLVGHASTDTVKELSVTLPAAFINASYAISTAFNDNGAGAHDWEVGHEIGSVPARTTTGFTIRYSRNGQQFGYTSAAGYVDYVAIGSWK